MPATNRARRGSTLSQFRTQTFRVVGSGFTLFTYNGSTVLNCQQIRDEPPRPVATPQEIQPLDARYPIEIAFPRAAHAGTLVLGIYEEWSRDIWQQFTPFASGINDIVDLFDASAALGGVTCVKLIVPPAPNRTRSVIYHNSVVVDMDRGETVAIENMVPTKTLTLMYTHTTRSFGSGTGSGSSPMATSPRR